jgi:hypothetical protein
MNTTYKYTRLSKDDAVVLLFDHQSGLISLVQDYSPEPGEQWGYCYVDRIFLERV